ncbi:MAG: hypothetical protein HRT89_04900, partial [Lentisphaeria bacterium]|nr:hypothetical protein [Lentisphaeria bacterium]
MSKIAYLTAAWPVWSETFIRQEIELIQKNNELEIFPIALFSGNMEVDDTMPDVFILDPGQTAAVPGKASILKNWVPGMIRRELSQFKHREMMIKFIQ